MNKEAWALVVFILFLISVYGKSRKAPFLENHKI
jgi:hypothetical protein